MIDDPENKWVTEGDRNVVYSGKRLLAYVGSAKQLTCTQLVLGELESDVALILVNKKNIEGLDGRRENMRALATSTNKVMKAEREKRCQHLNTTS